MSTSEQVAARRQKVAELTRQGCSTPHIARICGATPETIRRDRRALGISQGRAPDLTPQQLDTARQLLADGCSYRETARTIGCGHSALRRHFPGQGWTLSQSASWGMYIRKHASSSTANTATATHPGMTDGSPSPAASAPSTAPTSGTGHASAGRRCHTSKHRTCHDP